MKFDPRYQPHKAVSKDDMRPQLTRINFNKEATRLEVSDGHIMAVLPVSECEFDSPGQISTDAFKLIFRPRSKMVSQELEMQLDSKHAIFTGPRKIEYRIQRIPEGDESKAGKFPSLQPLIDQYTTTVKTRSVGINVHLLKVLVETMGVTSGCVELKIPMDSQDGIEVSPMVGEDLGSWGLIMPIRLT